jgi:predicted small integral membrane protein
VVALLFAVLYLAWGRQVWVFIGTIFSLLSAAEVFFQAKYQSLDALIFQSRLIGILYLGLAAGSYVMLSRI